MELSGGMRGLGGQGANIKMEELDELACPVCKNNHFVPTEKIKRIPALLSPNGQAGIAQLKIGVTCVKCGYFIAAKEMLVAATGNNMASTIFVPPPHGVVEDAKVIDTKDDGEEG